MSAKYEKYYFVCAYNEVGITEMNYFAVRDIFIASQPDYWVLLQPSSVVAYFRTKTEGQKRSEHLMAELDELQKSSPLFKDYGFGITESVFLVDMNLFGKIKMAPIGDTKLAYESAIKNSISNVAT